MEVRGPKNQRCNMKFIYTRILLICLSLLILSGCWDRVEIEDYSIIVGEAFDLEVEKDQETEQDEKKKQQPTILLTIQSVVPKVAAGQGGGGEKPYHNVYVKGKTVTELFFESTLKSDKIPFGHHLKVVVIGEELVRTTNIQSLLNELFRHPQVRRTSVVFIAKGQASKIFETKKPTDIPALGLLGMMENHDLTTDILPEMTLGQVSYNLTTDSSFLLQSVVSDKEKIKMAGGAVIQGKTKKLIGFLNNQEVMGMNWITGDADAEGAVAKAYDLETNKVTTIAIRSMNSKIKPNVQGKKISFDVEIEVEGSLEEEWMQGDAFDNNFLKRNEKAIEHEIKRLAEQALEKIQKEYQVDVGGFGTQLNIKYPEVWKKVEKDWDREFSKTTVSIHPKVFIRDYEMKGKIEAKK